MVTNNSVTALISGQTKFDINDYMCNEGLLLPAINERTWHPNVRCALYLVGLLWCFLAVAIVADIFMVAIERITSKTRPVRVPDDTAEEGFRTLELKV
jgi:solute carrier family 8 (sodium/calcium exchanger)